MLLDIAFVFIAMIGYLVAIIMASKTNKTQQINLTLSEDDIELIAQKVVEKLRAGPQAWKDYIPPFDNVRVSDFATIKVDESPVVLKSKTEGMEATGDWGDVQPVSDKIDAKTLESLKGLKTK